MRLLLDTHILLWAALNSPRLTVAARDLLTDPDNELIFSVVNIWEIAIKSGQGRADFQTEPALFRHRLLQNRYTELVVSGAHAISAGCLPPLHKDPFDRMLVAQSMVENLSLPTADPCVARYSPAIRLI